MIKYPNCSTPVIFESGSQSPNDMLGGLQPGDEVFFEFDETCTKPGKIKSISDTEVTIEWTDAVECFCGWHRGMDFVPETTFTVTRDMDWTYLYQKR